MIVVCDTYKYSRCQMGTLTHVDILCVNGPNYITHHLAYFNNIFSMNIGFRVWTLFE